jgi:hypothetical protein
MFGKVRPKTEEGRTPLILAINRWEYDRNFLILCG